MASGNSIYTRRFWRDTVERVIRTTAQVALAVFGVPVVGDAAGANIEALGGWQEKLVIVGATAILTLLTCLAGKATGDTSTASLTSGTPDSVVTYPAPVESRAGRSPYGRDVVTPR